MERVIDFLKYRWIAIGLSIAVITLFAVTTYLKGGFAWGIDFIGGVKLTVQFDGRTDPGEVRKELEKHGIKADVQQYGREELNEFIVSSKLLERGESSEKSSETIKSVLSAAFPKIKILATETVGPAVGDFLKKSAVKLMLIAVALMGLYLAFRFELKYSAGVMVAVVNDVAMAFLFCGFIGVEINIPIVAAILTIFGYSVNDTIVIFDRVRENLTIHAKSAFGQILNISVTQTLARTFITSLTVLFCVLSLYVIGEGTISDFALVMLAGLISGTYSTIYIAAPVVLWWHKARGE